MSITLNGTTGEVFPSWTTATRPASPVAGQTGYNTTLPALETYNGTTWVVSGANNKITQTILTTVGSGTYTVPTGVTWLRVRMVGGGAGGSGGGSGGVGGAGGNTTLGSSFLTANGGPSPTSSYSYSTLGGTASIGAGATGIAIQGGSGSQPSNPATSSTYNYGGNGGSSPFGGAGTAMWNGSSASLAAAVNSGSGGGGGSPTTVGIILPGCGGAAGGYIDCIISTPNASYSYTVGAGGTAGSAGTDGYAGGAGGSGIIIIEEHYNW